MYVRRSSRKGTRYSSQILVELGIFLTDFGKILKYQISLKSVQWEPSCSMRTDGQTDRQTDVTKLTVAFRNFANASKNSSQQGRTVMRDVEVGFRCPRSPQQMTISWCRSHGASSLLRNYNRQIENNANRKTVRETAQAGNPQLATDCYTAQTLKASTFWAYI
jgi:hypothetical protein